MDNVASLRQASHQVALRIVQESLAILAAWAGAEIQQQPVEIDSTSMGAIATAKELTAWPDNETIDVLQVIFDAIHLEPEQAQKTEVHYWPAWAINNCDDNCNNTHDTQKRYPPIPYPLTQPPSEEQIDALRQQVKQTLENLTAHDWEQLPLLMLILEKYGSYLSFGQANVALFDQVRATAAVAAALAEDPQVEQLCLVAADLSGIQDFIYTISSDGALKSLRARSFTLELVTEEIVQQLLGQLGLPRSSVIYAGGGNLYLLAPATEAASKIICAIRKQANDWLLEAFQGKVFLSLACHNFAKEETGQKKFAEHWEYVIKKLAVQKSRKFDQQLDQLLQPKTAHEPCKVCHRDDTEDLKPLGGDGVEACPTCCQMFDLGQRLFNVGALVRSSTPKISGALDTVKICIGDSPIYYHLFETARTIPQQPETVYLINNWDVDLYKFPHFRNPTLLLLGNYGQRIDPEPGTNQPPSYITAEKLADRSTGIARVGYLRMDVDRLGQIFAQGLGNQYSLPRLSGLSRQMSYFFKVYLNSLAAFRERDFLSHSEQNFQSLTNTLGQDLLFIYAGGDDLFVSGAWDQVVEFAFDIYQSFRAFTGYNPDITLSAGISLSGPKYPLYQAASDAGDAEEKAKGNGRDSLGLFEEVFKWQEWLGSRHQNISEIASVPQEIKKYIGESPTLPLFGIFPFVADLKDAFKGQYPRSFARNLLSTAQLQEQWIKKLKQEKTNRIKTRDPGEKQSKHISKNQPNEKTDEEKAVRYFLHLPRIAYTLARVSNNVQNSKEFEAVSISLKSPYNAPYFRAIATWLDLLNRNA